MWIISNLLTGKEKELDSILHLLTSSLLWINMRKGELECEYVCAPASFEV